ATNGVTVPLSETVRRGLFRGFVTLVGKASAPAPGQLRVQNGNVIRAEYLDASANSIISATAVVDTQPPVIQNIGAEPEYEQAVISWQTSKNTDALVQFGESTFLGRTAYEAELATSHEVTLVGLVPDRLYYY